MDDILLTEIRDGVATLSLNRPRQMNALSAALRRRFGEALAALEAGLELEGRPNQATTQRMDRAAFAATRAAVMPRGKEQSN